MINKLNYFGTDLDEAGHYWWLLDNDGISKIGYYTDQLPFNPEELNKKAEKNGTVHYIHFDNYTIIAICGSCHDSRPASKSVFWVNKHISFDELKELILSLPYSKKIIEQISFEIKW